jgi:hypothetical protein
MCNPMGNGVMGQPGRTGGGFKDTLNPTSGPAPMPSPMVAPMSADNPAFQTPTAAPMPNAAAAAGQGQMDYMNQFRPMSGQYDALRSAGQGAVDGAFGAGSFAQIPQGSMPTRDAGIPSGPLAPPPVRDAYNPEQGMGMRDARGPLDPEMMKRYRSDYRG